MNDIKKEKGITLVALVITIVVLLILAGIAITALTGDNNIIGKAKEAKDSYQTAQENENKILENYITNIENLCPGDEGDKYYVCRVEGEIYALVVKKNKEVPEPIMYMVDLENNSAIATDYTEDGTFSSSLKEYVLTEDIYKPSDDLPADWSQIESGTTVMTFGNEGYEEACFIYNGIVYFTPWSFPCPFEYEPNFEIGEIIEAEPEEESSK